MFDNLNFTISRSAVGCLSSALMVVLLVLSTAGTFADAGGVATEIHALLNDNKLFERFAGLAVDARRLKLFYSKRDFEPAWAREKRPRVAEVFAVLQAAVKEGLDPKNYAIDEIAARMSPKTTNERARLDLLLSAALTQYGGDLRGGRIAPGKADTEFYLPRKKVDTAVLLTDAELAPSLDAYFTGLAPKSPRYQRLRSALNAYRKLAARGGWPIFPAGKTLRLGMQDHRVGPLRRRLTLSGDLTAQTSSDVQYDAVLEAAVHRFQARHGLAVDGVVGAKTRAALNTAAKDRVAQIRLNLERRRWMPIDLGRHYVFVNLADFVLKVVDGERTVLDMRVVAGAPYQRTPVFTGTITYLDFNPFWNIPKGIAQEEVAPKARLDLDYLLTRRIRIFSDWSAQAKELPPRSIDWSAASKGFFPYRLRQDPGPRNPLGRVKFMFPNRYGVYLHDTPSRKLFDKPVRAFSHGCIRIEKPIELATYLLQANDSWTEPMVHEAMFADERRVVRLVRPMPVHLTYLTAWVNKDGSVHFRNDVYGRDERLAAALRRSSRLPAN